jgi:hypothetical protein
MKEMIRKSKEVVILNDSKSIEVIIEDVNGKKSLYIKDLGMMGDNYMVEGSLVDFEDISLMIQKAVQTMAEAA